MDHYGRSISFKEDNTDPARAKSGAWKRECDNNEVVLLTLAGKEGARWPFSSFCVLESLTRFRFVPIRFGCSKELIACHYRAGDEARRFCTGHKSTMRHCQRDSNFG